MSLAAGSCGATDRTDSAWARASDKPDQLDRSGRQSAIGIGAALGARAAEGTPLRLVCGAESDASGTCS